MLTEKSRLQQIVLSGDAALFGVCRVDELRESFHAEIKRISEKLNTAISIGVPLTGAVLETLIDRPNQIYKAHYRQVNAILDDTASAIASEIGRMGYQALPIPASMVLKRYPMTAHLSHREIAFKAGLGWWGRNNLLVTPQFGSQIRLVTVLTDMEFEPNTFIEDDCGDCYNCMGVCPAGAIADTKEGFVLQACSDRLQEFSRTNDFGAYICGLCLKACPGKGRPKR
jgi:epoxyqueuosine reductase QueG